MRHQRYFCRTWPSWNTMHMNQLKNEAPSPINYAVLRSSSSEEQPTLRLNVENCALQRWQQLASSHSGGTCAENIASLSFSCGNFTPSAARIIVIVSCTALKYGSDNGATVNGMAIQSDSAIVITYVYCTFFLFFFTLALLFADCCFVFFLYPRIVSVQGARGINYENNYSEASCRHQCSLRSDVSLNNFYTVWNV